MPRKTIFSPIKLTATFASCFALAFTIGSITFIPRSSHADTTDVNLEVDTILSMTTSPEVNLAITPLPTGIQSTANATATVSTNNSTGYYLDLSAKYATVGAFPGTSLIHTDNATTLPSTTNSTAATLAANTWGYNLGAVQTTFLAIPSYSLPATLKTTTTPINNETTTITLGAKADLTAKVGTYSQTLVFTAVTRPTPVNLRITSVSPSINMVGGDAYITGTRFYAGGAVSAVTGVTIGGKACSSYKVFSDTSIRCVLPDKAAVDTAYSVVVTTSEATSNSDKTVTYDSINKGTMQDFGQNNTTTTCSNMPMGQAQIYTDSRNGQTYRIKKMADNKCWMIDNLKYAYGTLDGTASTSAPRYYDYATTEEYCIDSNNDLAGSTTKCGYYYNWYGVTYGTGTAAMLGNAHATGSICPNNSNPGNTDSSPWHIPDASDGTATASNEFALLNGMMGGIGGPSIDEGINNNDYSFGLNWYFNGPFAGTQTGAAWLPAPEYGGSIGDFVGNDLVYASSTAYDAYDTDVRVLYSGPGGFHPGDYQGYKKDGYVARCVMNP